MPGQLARYIKVPWRSSSATASNAPDAQAAYEAQMSLWGALMGGANFMLHAAGWVEGGLSTSYEKFIIDIEMLQMFAELFQPVGAEASDIALEAIAEVGYGGHFFACAHTMERYRTAFYTPLRLGLAQLRPMVRTTARRPRPSAPTRSTRTRWRATSRRNATLRSSKR